MDKKYLPFALPCVGQDEIDEVVDTIRSGWLTTGSKTKRFEHEFAEYINVKNALAVNSATAGLHLALDAIGVKAGDKLITTPNTFTATTEVMRYLGADPIFVDIEPDTFNLNPENMSPILEKQDIKAVVPVHFAGQACDMDSITSLADKYNIKIVEDAAHALPTTYKGNMIGVIGDITVFSFYVTKTLATGEGGMIVTNNQDYADRMSMMRLHGINRDVFNRYTSNKPAWYYEVVAPGFKYNMTDIAASIGVHQLKKIADFQKRREWIARQYDEAFSDLPLRIPFVKRPDDIHAWHLYVIQLELESLAIDRNKFIELMSEEGIGTSVHFIPLHIQPYWRDKYSYKPEDFPIALDVYQRSVSLPIYPKMSDSDVGRVIDAVRDILLQHSK